jgi:predicted PurR-regulated permease PerM
VMPTLGDKKRAVRIAHDIGAHVSRYLLTVTAINICLGIIVGLTLLALGMPNPGLWGALACVLNFVPYVGAITGVVALALAALLSFDNLAWALVFPAAYFALTAIEGNFVTPLILGRSFTLNPIVLVLGLLFWTWMWGIPGTLLAVPIVVTFRIFCEHIDSLAPLRDLLDG